MSKPLALNESLLASICLANEDDPQTEIAQLTLIEQSLRTHFLYYEIVYVLGERHKAAVSAQAAALAEIRNLRIVLVRDGMSFYRRRAMATSEAIGDVALLTTFDELESFDLCAFAEEAHQRGVILMGRRPRSFADFSPIHGLMSFASSYRVDGADMRTIAAPRRSLNWLLPRPTLALDLRFEPKRTAEPYARRVVEKSGARVRRSGLRDRYELFQELISSSAPRLLRIYAMLSTLVAGLAFLYGVYAVATLCFDPNIQEGWFSTAIVQSGSVGFIAIGMTVLGIGVAEIAERLSGHARHGIVEEIANISFFDRTFDLNVETENGRQRVEADHD